MNVFPFSTQEDFSHHPCGASLNGLDRKRQKSKPEIAVIMYYHVFQNYVGRVIKRLTVARPENKNKIKHHTDDMEVHSPRLSVV